MHSKFLIVSVVILLVSCHFEPVIEFQEENWSKRAIEINPMDSLEIGESYLSVYSQMYSFTQKQKYNLTGMISMRNVSDRDTIYLTRADYYNTEGEKIRTYFNYPIFILPMETIEIVIDQEDVEGGTGSNFIFDWRIPPGCPEPLFEGVMNSLQGTQGLAFTTQAIRIK